MSTALSGARRHGLKGAERLVATSTAAVALALVLSVAGGYAVAHGSMLVLLIGVIAIAACLAAPLEYVALGAVVVANGALEFSHALQGNRGAAASAALVAVVVLRSLAMRGIPRRQAAAGAAVAAVLALEFVNALTLVGRSEIKPIATAAMPYAMLLLVLVALPRERLARLFKLLAIWAALTAALYVASVLLHQALVPGVYRTQTASFGGYAVQRTWAPGGMLFLFGTVWGMVRLISAPQERRLALVVLVPSLAAVILTLSLTVFAAAVVAIVLVVLVLSRSSLRTASRRRRSMTGVVLLLTVALSLSGLFLSERLTTKTTSAESASSDFQSRLLTVRQSSNQVAKHPGLGAGFTPANPGTVDLSDSGLFTVVARFGLVGVIALVALLVTAARSIRRLMRGDPGQREIAAVTAGLLGAYVTVAPTTDALSSTGGLALLAVVCGALYASDPSSTRAAVPQAVRRRGTSRHARLQPTSPRNA